LKRTAIALVLAAGLAACGSSRDNAKPTLTGGQAQALVAQLEAVRATAATRDVAATKAALESFKASVARLRRAGALSDDAARALRIGAARVLARVRSDNPPPPQPAQTAPAATQPAPLPPGEAKKKEGKRGKGKGHGPKGGEGGD
jgi:hypothetical protein